MKRNQALRWIPVILVLLLAGLLAFGCNGGSGENAGENGANGPPLSGEAALFFACAEAVNSGEPGEFGFVAPVFRAAPAGEEKKLLGTIELLIAGPLAGEEGFYAVVPSTARVLGLTVDGGTAVIDLSVEALTDSPGGTLAGTIFIQAMVYTATQFPEVDKVMVLVGGETWCDGHSVWDEPLGPDDLL